MSLKVWLPSQTDFKNYIGPNPNIIGSPTTDAAGKIGTAMKTSNSCYVELPYSTKLANTSSISFGGWFKLTIDEIATIVNGLAYDSNKTYASNQLIGNSSYGGMGIVWTSNRMLENPVLTTMNVACQLRTASGSFQTNATTLNSNEWTHLFYVWDKNTKILSFYKNGELIHGYSLNRDFTDIVDRNLMVNYSGTYGGNGPAVRIPFSVNDVRIYDEALSELQIHELYKCLTIHYKLDQITHTPVNAYAYPTFETSAAGGGWNHWGQSGASGTYGQTTDSQYIYGSQTYSHWVANAAEATGNYLLYQSPEYAGGLRSFQCIVKEENSRPITESICYPAWNARNGGATNNAFTSIIPLRDGFYLCKVEGISQDGSNDLVGLYIRPGYKVYVSIMVLEDLRALCSDILYHRNYIIDSTGFKNNGIISEAIDANPYSPRYKYCTLFDGNSGTIRVPFNNAIDNLNKIYSFSLWFFKDAYGSKGHETLFGGPSGFEIESKEGTNNNPMVKLWSWGQGSVPYSLNTWNHIVFVQDLTNAKLYLNGELALTGTRNATIPVGNYFLGAWNTTTQQNYLGYMSDFRVYANALTENDVKQLYNIPMNIDSKSNVHCYDFIENSGNLFARSFLTNSYGNKTTSAPHPQIWGDTSTGCLINSNGEIEFLGANGSIGSKYIKIKPGIYYYEIEYSVATGNQFYIQFERYDAAKTSRTNNAAVNLLQVKPTTDLTHEYKYGTVDLSTDGTNPCDTIALRILNRWSGSESTTTGKATVHRFSVRLENECKNPSLLIDGLFSDIGLKTDLNENKKSSFYNTGVTEAANFIEK